MPIGMIRIAFVIAALGLGPIDWRGAFADTENSGHSNAPVAANGSDTQIAPLANRRPRVNRRIPDQTVQEGDSLSYRIPARTFQDPDGDTLRITAQMQSNWLSFDQRRQRIVGTPLAFDAPAVVRVRATDQRGASATTSFQVRIRPRTLGDETSQSTPSPDFDGTTDSTEPSISADGRFVAHVYESAEVDEESIVVRDFTFADFSDRGSFTVAGPVPFTGGNKFASPSISADGRTVAFAAARGQGAEIRVVRIANSEPLELETKFVQRIRNSDDPIDVSLSGNGRVVAFEQGTDVVIATIGKRERLVINNAGSPSLSGNGRRLAYEEVTDSEEKIIFVARLNTSSMTVVDTIVAGVDIDDSEFGLRLPSNPVVSANGRFVAFESSVSELVPNDSNGVRDIFVYDTINQTINRVNVDANGDQADAPSFNPSLSRNGSLVAFDTIETSVDPSLVDPSQILVRRLRQGEPNGELRFASIDGNGVRGNRESVRPSLSADARFVTFESAANNLTPDAAANQGITVFLAPTIPDNAPVVDLPFDPRGDISTRARLVLGAPRRGEIDPAGDADWYSVDLIEGQVYRFALRADDSNGAPLDDPYLEVRDITDEVVAEDDDSGGGINNRDALLEYRAEVSGTFFIVARAFRAGTGDFLLAGDVSPLATTVSR